MLNGNSEKLASTRVVKDDNATRKRHKKNLAERGGFEPPIRFNPYNGLANRRLQPLGHLSN